MPVASQTPQLLLAGMHGPHEGSQERPGSKSAQGLGPKFFFEGLHMPQVGPGALNPPCLFLHDEGFGLGGLFWGLGCRLAQDVS